MPLIASTYFQEARDRSEKSKI